MAETNVDKLSTQDQPSQEDLAKMLQMLLANPAFVRMLQQTMAQASAQSDPISQMRRLMGGAGPTGYVDNPLAAMPMGSAPSSGPYVQWMGGMPPGYNDSVARKLAIGANVGNLGGYNALGGLLSGIAKGLFGGK